MNANELTICSVVYDAKWQLDLNWELTTKLNPKIKLNWLLVLNKPIQEQYKPTLSLTPKYEVIEGAEPDPIVSDRMISFHHARGLNLAMSHIKSRYLLVLDPDCYVLQKNWIEDSIAYMKKMGLAFFGVPYNPRRFRKARYFPTGYCIFIDTFQVSASSLNWEPRELREQVYPFKDKVWRKINYLLKGDQRRNSAGREMDTGIRLFEEYQHDHRFKTECIQPVFDPKEIYPERNGKRPWLEYVLPDRFCLIPKRTNYFSRKRFCDYGWPDMKSLGSEEYVWQDKPYAVHMRFRHVNKKYDVAIDCEMTQEYLKQFEELAMTSEALRP